MFISTPIYLHQLHRERREEILLICTEREREHLKYAFQNPLTFVCASPVHVRNGRTVLEGDRLLRILTPVRTDNGGVK